MGTIQKPNRKPSIKQKRAIENAVENRGNISKAMRDAGYPASTAKNPKNLTESRAWKEIMEDALPDKDIAAHHKALLNAKSLDHMVFPLEGSDKQTKDLGKQQAKLTDVDIIDMLAEEGCNVKRIIHGEQARHVYFWSNDNNSRKAAIDMAYKLKGNYAAEKSVVANIHLNGDKQEKSNSLIEGILGNQENT